LVSSSGCEPRLGLRAGARRGQFPLASERFILDTMVATQAERAGVGASLIALAQKGARDAGCEWLHVDFEHHLRPFYFGSCGFKSTNAGLIDLLARPVNALDDRA